MLFRSYLGGDHEVALADLHAGDHFGELSAVDARERSARVAGSGHCLIASLRREDFLELLAQHPKVALRLLDHFAAIIRAMNDRVSALSTLSPRQRIYDELLRLAEPNPTDDGTWIIEVVPSHHEIASWAGTDKQDVANAIGALVRDDIMTRRHKSFVITNHPKLKRLSIM